MSADIKQVKGAGPGKTAPNKSLLQLNTKHKFQLLLNVVHVGACVCSHVRFSAKEPLIRHHLIVFQFVASDAQPRV